ncbi:MAG: NAD(P)-binding domain-containing protein [Proteobacteria bacterium]|nr:NAD(P)-binding domain-containing protein [Pseudomonadota bacterium]
MTLLKSIQAKTAKIGVIGLGYVGLPLVIRFGEEGFTVTGFDIDEEKIESLNAGKSYIHHIPNTELKELIRRGKLKATTDFKNLQSMDAILICVPTPLNEMREPDLRYVEKTGEIIARYLRKGQIVSLESTTYPGTTDEILLLKFEHNHLNDPYVPQLKKTRKFHFVMSSVNLTKQVIKKMDVVLIATDHGRYDYPWIAEHASLVVDTRNAIRSKERYSGKVVAA